MKCQKRIRCNISTLKHIIFDTILLKGNFSMICCLQRIRLQEAWYKVYFSANVFHIILLDAPLCKKNVMLKEWTSFFLIFISFFLCIKASHFPLFITFDEKKNDSQTISVIYFHRKKNGVRTAPFFLCNLSNQNNGQWGLLTWNGTLSRRKSHEKVIK